MLVRACVRACVRAWCCFCDATARGVLFVLVLVFLLLFKCAWMHARVGAGLHSRTQFLVPSIYISHIRVLAKTISLSAASFSWNASDSMLRPHINRIHQAGYIEPTGDYTGPSKRTQIRQADPNEYERTRF